MEKLICENCFTENEIKNEQVVFCNKCHKKLALNFTDWKKERSQPDFTIFTKEFEQHNSKALSLIHDLKANEVKSNSRKTFLKFAASIALIIIVFFVSLQNQRNSILNFNSLADNTNYLNEIHWKNYSFGDSLSITLPYDLKYTETIIPENLAHYTHSIKSLRAESSNSFSVTIEEYELSQYFATNHFPFIDLQDEYVLSSGADVIPIYDNDRLSMKSYSTNIEHNSFIANNETYISDNYTFTRGNKGIKVIVSYLKNNKLLNKYADIVNESIYKNA